MMKNNRTGSALVTVIWVVLLPDCEELDQFVPSVLFCH